MSWTIKEAGTEPGEAGRLAIPVGGDAAAAKAVVFGLVSQTWFDALDGGTLTKSWRYQPGTPAYCTELRSDELTIALADAKQEKAPKSRDAIMQALSSGDVEITCSNLLSVNRRLSA